MGTRVPASGGGAVQGAARSPSSGVDFFVSYTGADQGWAEWIAWVLEDAGYRVRIQTWDFNAGSHFVTEMHQAAQVAARTIAVLSTAYLSSAFAEAEWQAAWAADPSGRARKLLVFRVEECDRPGLLGQLVSVDLFGLDRDIAAGRLVAAARGERSKPAVEPVFPGGPAQPMVTATGMEPTFPGRLPDVWNVPSRNRHFTGRQSQLDQIRTELGSGPVAVTTLHGMGGVGKTQLAVEYAHRHAAEYTLVWWIDAEQTLLVGEKFAALAGPLGLSTDGAVSDIAAIVLAALGRRVGWLVVFDNAEDPVALRDWLPSGPGHVLITSRNPGWEALAAAVDVDVFERAEAVAFLTRRLPGLNAAVADALAAELGDLPLALAQAAGYLTTTRTDPASYLAKFRTRRTTLLGKGGDPLYAGTIATAWSMALERLRADAPATVQLLTLCALLAPEPIPLALFDDHPDLLDGPLAQACAGTHPRLDLDDVVGDALAYSLARRSGNTIQLHRLVGAVIAGQLPEERRDVLRGVVVALVEAALPDEPHRSGTWPVYAMLVPHARIVFRPDRPGVLKLLEYLDASGDYRTAKIVQEDVHNDTVARLGAEHPAALRTRAAVANWTGEAGDPGGARDMLAALLPVCDRALGADDRQTLLVAARLADWTGQAGDWPGARDLCLSILPRWRRVAGEDDPETLYVWANLGFWTGQAGDVAGACAHYAAFLPIRERVLGPEHPDVLESRDQYARWIGEAGDPAAARDLCSALLTVHERVSGAEHHGTLWVRTNLAWWTGKAGDPAAARDQYAQLLPIRERVSGPEHPATLVARGNFAYWVGQAGDPAMARDQYAALLLIHRRVLGPDHPDTLLDQRNLAHWTGEAGDPAGARDQFAAVLALFERALGPEHRETVAARTELAVWTAAAPDWAAPPPGSATAGRP